MHQIQGYRSHELMAANIIIHMIIIIIVTNSMRTCVVYYKNKNIFEKMSEYVGFSPPPTYFLHIRCDQ